MEWLRFFAVLCASALLLPAQIAFQTYLGLGLISLENRPGAIVKSLDPGGPAARAGILAGDILIAFNDQNIGGGQDISALVHAMPVQSRVRIQLLRDGRPRIVTLITGSRPVVSATALGTQRTNNMGPDFSGGMPVEIPSTLLVWKNLALGVETEDLQPQMSPFFGVPRGALVRDVEKGSVADASGLRVGDVIVGCGSEAITGARELTAAVELDAAQTATPHLKVVRQRKRMDLILHLGN